MPLLCVVLPTYNEAENCRQLIPAIFAQTKAMADTDLHVLVVDDDSPDGTADVIRSFMADHPNLHLISGEKKGLGDAYKRGMAHAVATLHPDHIVEMDADLQHDPAMLPVFADLAKHGFTLVIGSRFVTGGETPGFPPRRRALSLAAAWLFRILGGMPDIKDCTSGYRCISAELIARCDLSDLSTRGYAFQTSLLYELLRNGARLIEVPISFPQRAEGESKLRFRDQVEFLVNLFRIRFRKSEEFFRFCATGLVGVLVYMGCYWFFTRQGGLPLEWAALLALEASILANFVAHLLPLPAANIAPFLRGEGLHAKLARFHGLALPGATVSYAVLLLLARGAGLWDMAANVAALAAAVPVTSFLHAWWNRRQRS